MSQSVILDCRLCELFVQVFSYKLHRKKAKSYMSFTCQQKIPKHPLFMRFSKIGLFLIQKMSRKTSHENLSKKCFFLGQVHTILLNIESIKISMNEIECKSLLIKKNGSLKYTHLQAKPTLICQTGIQQHGGRTILN